MRAGFPVPPGFVITVDAFVEHFGHLTDGLVKPNTPTLQSELMAEVVQGIVQWLGEEKYFAVRSSASEEDAEHASFAGMHSTYYFVPPNRIDEAIVDCWMSLWSDAALSYRRSGWQDLIPGEHPSMAIIVQQMVDAQRSGVVFSRDPLSLNYEQTNTPDSVIEASWGLGAALVDGRISPDHVIANELGEIKSYEIGKKTHQVQSNAANRQGQRLQEVDKHKQQQAVLTEHEVKHLVNLSHQLETLFDFPQDIEFAYSKEQLYLLQTRPISTTNEHHNIAEKLVLFQPMVENFTEPLTPMSQSIYAAVVPKVGSFYRGYFYLDVDLLNKLLPFNLTDHEVVTLAQLEPLETPLTLSPTKLLRAFGLGLAAYLADGINWLRTGWLSHLDLDYFVTLCNQVSEDQKINALQALERLTWGKHPFEPITSRMLYVNISGGRYFLYLALLNLLVKRWLPQYDTQNLSRIYHQQDDMASLALVNNVTQLTQTLREIYALEEAETQTKKDKLVGDAPTNNDVAGSLKTHISQLIEGKSFDLPLHHPFTEAFNKFLRSYEHRGPRELELAAPRWGENPMDLLKLIHTNALTPPIQQHPYATHLLARDELNQQLSAWQRKIVAILVNKIRHFIVLRENTRQHHIRAMTVSRNKLLNLEQDLIRRDLLNVPGDIFFLTHEEALSLSTNNLHPDDAHTLIVKRRRTWLRRTRTKLLKTINVDDHDEILSSQTLKSADPQTPLSGRCASPGVATGYARVILSLSQADQLKPGEILIAPYTDPAWTPLFTQAAAVVVETGSFLSHAGNVARELQVPCLVNVEDCTALIRSGAHIRVDANAGTVSWSDANHQAQIQEKEPTTQAETTDDG